MDKVGIGWAYIYHAADRGGFPWAVELGQPLPSSSLSYVMLSSMHVLTLALFYGFASAASVIPSFSYTGLSSQKADLVKANLVKIATHRYDRPGTCFA